MGRKKKFVLNKPIPGFSRYTVNEFGDYVYDTVAERQIPTHLYKSCDYITVAELVSDEGIILRNYPVHRLVALAFVPKPDNCNIVHHVDGDKLNNYRHNLLWVTNEVHSYIHQNLKLQGFSIIKD